VSALRDRFLEHTTDPVRATFSHHQALDELLNEVVSAGRTAWPEVDVDTGDFLSYVAERITESGSPQQVLRGVRAADLYLACACARGNGTAIAALEATYFARLEPALPRAPDPRAFASEVRAALRERLFVAAAGDTPKITEYSGRSDLAGWLRVVAVRLALNLLRKDKRNVAGSHDEMIAALPAPGDDPELLHLKGKYKSEFRQALVEAAAALSVRDRNLLRQHHVDGLGMEQLAELYHVHRVTAVRWVVRARETLASETRRALRRRLRVDKQELDSIMRLVRSRLDMSIKTLLNEQSDAPKD
jgi:RNA polymerase sigma-70 factor (ECF subfamily)